MKKEVKSNRYTKEIKEFCKVRMEQTNNDTQIARDIVKKFGLDKKVNAVRNWVQTNRADFRIEASKRPFKRLFFDIETGYYTLSIRAWQLKNYTKYFSPDTIVKEKEIICISYKWQHEDKVHTLDFRNGEKKMLKEFINIMGEADEVIGHNGDRFDIKNIRTRCIKHGVLMFPQYRSLDTLKKARSYFSFASNKLDYIGKYLEVGKKLDHEGMQMWIDIIEHKDMDALKRMIEYCEQDVILLEDVYHVLSPYINHENNFAVLTGGEKWDCPECTSDKVVMHHTYTTAMGVIRRQMKCNNCKKQYKISNKNYMAMLEYVSKH